MSTPHPTPEHREISELLDSSFGDGPQPTPPAQHLRAGQRSLLRRRAAGALGVVAAVAVVATTAFVTLGDDDTATSSGIPAAGQGTDPVATPDPAPTPEALEAPEGQGPTDVWIEDGTLHAGSAVATSKIIEDPLHTDEPSFALQGRVDGTEYYYLLAGDQVTKQPARRGPGSFEQWLAQAYTRDGHPFALVTFGDGETLDPVDGRTVVEQTGEVNLPDNFAGPGDRTAAAVVDFGGERWFVLARQFAQGPADYIIFARDGDVRTLAQFLVYSQQQYSDEVGLR